MPRRGPAALPAAAAAAALLCAALSRAPGAAAEEPAEDEDALPAEGGEAVEKEEKKKVECKEPYPRMSAAEFPPQPGTKVFSAEELKLYDGTDCSQPLLLAIMGEVFDVGTGKEYYAPGHGYQGFAGRDASKAFITGEYEEQEGIDSMADFTPEQVQGVVDWRGFYRDHKPDNKKQEKYRFVGLLDGRYYDAEGKPTPALSAAEAKFDIWKKTSDVKGEFEKRFKGCNSRTEAKNTYFELWCDDGYHGKGTMPFHMYYSFPSREDLKEVGKCVCATEADRAEADAIQSDPRAGGKPTPGQKVVYRFVQYSDCIAGGGKKCRRPKGAKPPE